MALVLHRRQPVTSPSDGATFCDVYWVAYRIPGVWSKTYWSELSSAQYLSAVQQRQKDLFGEAVPSLPLVSHVLRAYACWEEENQPHRAVRCGLSAVQLLRVWELGISSFYIGVVRLISSPTHVSGFSRLL